MKLIVGLGNPGNQYVGTPHNVGFGVVDIIAERYVVQFKKKKKNALYAEAIIGSEKVMLIKPQTFMNNSGDSVFQYVEMFKIDLSDIVVILDDIELTPGLIRTRLSGTGGTHNGLKNICLRLGSHNFARIRVGVGAPADGQDLADYVLTKMSEDKAKLVKVGMEKAADYAIDFVQGKKVVTTV